MKTKKKSLLCRLGIHKYEQMNDNFFSSAVLERLGVPCIKARRRCSRCLKLQEQEIHCLGLNPPRYVHHWIDIKEPAIVNADGMTLVYVDKKGRFFIMDKEYDACYSLGIGKPLGKISQQGDYQILGKYSIGNN